MGQPRPLIAVLLGAPLTAQNYRRTGIPYLVAHFDVVVLDCNRWLRPGYSSLSYVMHPYPDREEISSAEDFASAISGLKPTFAVDFICPGEWTDYIQKVLGDQGTQFVVQKMGTVPVRSAWHVAREALLGRRLYRLLRGRLARLLRAHRSAPAPDLALLAGRRSLDAVARTAKKIVWVGSTDYHEFRRVRREALEAESGGVTRGEYAVFLDEALALSTDYQLLGIPPPVHPGRYHASLRSAFDRMERATGLPVVVAAHPSGTGIEGYQGLFGERDVYFGMTPELCSRAGLVLAHASTSLSYAVLWARPVVILTSRLLDSSTTGAAIREYRTRLKCPLLFMESDESAYRHAFRKSTDINVGAYRSYEEDFIVTPEVDEERPWEAFISLVRDGARTSVAG